MYANDNIKLMEEFYKIADAKPFNKTKLKTFIQDEYIDHDGEKGEEKKSSEYMVNFFEALSNGSSNGKHEITFIKVVDKNSVLLRWRFKGKHDGNFFGAFPATNNEFDIAGMEVWEIKDGKISGIWHIEELNKFFEQLSAPK